MNRNILRLLLLIICGGGAIVVPAQPPAGYTEITPAKTSASSPLGDVASDCWIRESGVYDEARLKPLLADKKCAESIKALGIDFAKQTLVGYSVASDCHMRVWTKVFRSDTEKKFLVIINNIYGGCRAGGWREGWIVLDKMPADYTLDMKVVMVDPVHRPGTAEDEFQFPKQPSGIKPEMLESREIDVKGCLPLDRQSQWVLIKDEYLQKALEGKSKECVEHFKNLAINFDKYTLAGYNVDTGACRRPPGLTQKLFKDTDENRFVLEISYPENIGACHIIIYQPIWVLTPKLPEGYSFEFKENPIKRQID